MYRKVHIFIFAIITVSFFACKQRSDDNILQPLPVQLQGATKNAMEVLESDPQFSSFAAAIKKVGLDAEIKRFPARFTIFAPNNQAFSSVNVANLPDSAVRNIIRYHVFQTESFRFAKQFTSGPNETNAQLPNNLVWINVPRLGEVFINGTPVVRADIPATNAVIHEIGTVLVPPTKTMYQIISETPTLSRFRNAANFTADLTAPNQAPSTIRQILRSTRFQGTVAPNSNASTIFGGINATVFVPSDAAFEAITGLPGTPITDSVSLRNFIITNFGSLASTAWDNILRHHISTAAGRNFSGGLLSGALPSIVAQRPMNLNVSTIGVVVNQRTIIGSVVQTNPPIGSANNFNNARVVTTDIIATNGVIHVIDKVLRPEL
jgi:uncharacterized surface protein with fasciclin (FAS1) repeats